jgi:hypothetical protein
MDNNTPVNTEVLWGGGLWWGLLRTIVPTANHVQQVFDVASGHHHPQPPITISRSVMSTSPS